MNVAAILKAKGRGVATCAPDTPLHEVAKLLADKRIGATVVVDGKGAVAGILSERDLVRIIASRGGTCLPEPASAIMTRNVVTCAPEETLQALMSKMTAGRFRHVPVVEHGQLIGIVSIGDLAREKDPSSALAEISAAPANN